MSEETSTETTNDGTWSGLKKTIIGTLTTLIAGGGTWLGVVLFQGGESAGEAEEKVKTEQTSQPVINLNVDNSSQNNSSNSNGGSTTVIREKVVEKPAKEEKKKEEKSESEDAPW
jgi:hypothetical protein